MIETNIDMVERFLTIVRRCIKKHQMILVNRNHIDIGGKIVNTKQALVDLEITIQDMWKIISNLTSNDFIRVSFDYDIKRDNNSEIFEFVKEIKHISVYIKLTVDEARGLVCLSFHRSNRGKD